MDVNYIESRSVLAYWVSEYVKVNQYNLTSTSNELVADDDDYYVPSRATSTINETSTVNSH